MSIHKYRKDKSRQRLQEEGKEAEPTQSYPYPTSAPSWSHSSHKNSSNYLCLICGDRVILVVVTDPVHSNKITMHLNFTDVRTSWPPLAFKRFTPFVSPYQSLHFAAGILELNYWCHCSFPISAVLGVQPSIFNVNIGLIMVYVCLDVELNCLGWRTGQKKCSTKAQIICWVTLNEIMIFCGVASTSTVNVNNNIHQH